MPWFKKTKSYTLLKKSNKSKKSNTVTYTKKKKQHPIVIIQD